MLTSLSVWISVWNGRNACHRPHAGIRIRWPHDAAAAVKTSRRLWKIPHGRVRDRRKSGECTVSTEA
jgi:hypothetical protein